MYLDSMFVVFFNNIFRLTSNNVTMFFICRISSVGSGGCIHKSLKNYNFAVDVLDFFKIIIIKYSITCRTAS